MLVLAGIYINNRQNAGQRKEIPWEKQRLFETGGIVSAKMDKNQVSPVQVTVTSGGKTRTVVYNDNLISRVYDDFFTFAIPGLFSRSADCKILDKIEGEEFWRKCAEKEDSVYIKYAGDYIYPVLYAFLTENYDSADASKAIAKVRELFIINEDPVFGAARDSEGNVAVFMPSGLNREYISEQINASIQVAYNNSEGGIPCRFFK
jgi:hypothetical protein